MPGSMDLRMTLRENVTLMYISVYSATSENPKGKEIAQFVYVALLIRNKLLYWTAIRTISIMNLVYESFSKIQIQAVLFAGSRLN